MKWFGISSLAALALLSTGCDWESGGDNGSYNSRYNWFNVSGVYRGVNGGLLITDYTSTPGTPGTTNDARNEQVAVADGSKTVFSGVVRYRNIVPGTFSVSSAGFQLRDGGAGVLLGSGSTGAIDYATGAWSIDLGGFAPDNGSPIYASYQHTVEGKGEVGPGSGTSRYPIYSFSVAQTGEVVEIIDNNGATYKGKMGSIRASGGVTSDVNSGGFPSAGDQVIGIFEVSGVSKAGFTVRITGTFQGTVGGETQIMDRRMYGTWLEAGGKTGDINGQASPIGIDTTSFSNFESQSSTTP